MTNYYLETYVVNRTRYGIEDYKQKGVEHFMPESCAKNGRFHLWSGGCGIGYKDTLQDARFELLKYIHENAIRKRDNLVRKLGKVSQVLDIINDSKQPLLFFKKEGAEEGK